MEVNISEQGKWERIVEVTVPYEELVPKFEEAYTKYKKSIQLEGFRKGKVPLSLIKRVFGTKIETEVAEDSISEFLEKAVEDNKIKLYDLSKLESVDFKRESGLKFKAVVKIQPEIDVEKYKNLKVEKEIYQVTDADINEAIENLREQHATMVNIDGEAQRGNYIVADIQKTDWSGVPLIGQKFENRYLQLGNDETDNEFVEQLIGVKAGDSRRITLRAPNHQAGENVPNEEEEHYLVEVKEIKAKSLPEIDDEFARDLGDYENLDSFKEAIRKNLEKQFEENTKIILSNRLMDETIKNNPIELPEYMIDNYLKAFIEKVKTDSKEQLDEQELRQKYRADAIWNLKWSMIKEKISDLESIEVEDQEVSDYIEELAKRAGKNATLVRSNYRDKNNREKVKRKIEENKIIDLLINSAEIIEKTTTYRDRMEEKKIIV